VHCIQAERHHIANDVYASIADMLAHEPESFGATMDGLAISTHDIDRALGSISRSQAISVALDDGYLIRATHSYWLLLPEAFNCDDEWLPSGVQDCRCMSVRTWSTAERWADACPFTPPSEAEAQSR
jgi:hypothetical protein